MEWPCVESCQDGVILRVRATPKAARTEPTGLIADERGNQRLGLRVKAPPVEGKANEAILSWIALTFGIRGSSVTLLRGARAREKDLLLAGATAHQVNAILDRLLPVNGD